MKRDLARFTLLLAISVCLLTPAYAAAPAPAGLDHHGQKLFLSGINLAWMDFGKDLVNFNEPMFTKALDEIAAGGGNAMRWWLHVNGSQTPVFGDEGKVVGMPPKALANLKHALDLAYDKGIGVVMCLWSFDMLQRQAGVNAVANKEMVENPEYTEAYIDNALIPMLKTVKDHPAVFAWEVCNEPEGMTDAYGWTPLRTKMRYVQQFVNLIAGAIHRQLPGAKVTNGSWSFLASTDVDGFTNYYRDDRLIAAGGDKLGTLDFYQVHYYPQNADERTSPFHHPASYWQLDKPILIGEFPAKGIVKFGPSFKPKTSLSPGEAYRFAIENGYIGALSWTWTNHDGNGGMPEAGPAMSALKKLYPQHLTLEKSPFNHQPFVRRPIPPVHVSMDAPPLPAYINLRDVFYDPEDGENLKTFSVAGNSNPGLVEVRISGAALSLSFTPKASGRAVIVIKAVDSGGEEALAEFSVFVINPDKDDLALLRPTQASSNEGADYGPSCSNDGRNDTRFSTAYADNQWLIIDLGKAYELSRAVIRWEAAFGRHYQLLFSENAADWRMVYEQQEGKGGVEELGFPPARARYVKLNLLKRGTNWGFSLWELELYH